MADITEVEQWDEGVYQLETTDPVQGGADGVDNLPHIALANRTKWLKAGLKAVQNTISNFGDTYLGKNAKAVDSDKLNGLNSSDFVQRVYSELENLDTHFNNGLYRVKDTAIGNPTGSYGSVVIFGNNNNVVTQLFTHFKTAVTYARSYNTSWSSWKRLDNEGFNFKPYHVALVSNINTSNSNARYTADLTGYINSGTTAIALNLSRYMSDSGNYHSYLSGYIYQDGNPNKTFFHNTTFQNYANHFDSFMIVQIDPNGSKTLKIDIISALNDNSSSGQTIELKGVIS
jgi:hypothetical protein